MPADNRTTGANQGQSPKSLTSMQYSVLTFSALNGEYTCSETRLRTKQSCQHFHNNVSKPAGNETAQ